jgi:hypothetical protein
MFASLRTLLTGIIDYAGLFPPAKLPLDQAIRNYARYRQGSDAWMLGRFVIPAARLEDLEPYHEELFRIDPPFAFSVLGRGGATMKEFLAYLRDDLRDIAAFRKRHGERVAVDVLETRIPADLADPNRADSTLDLLKIIRLFPAIDLFLFGEATGRPDGLLEQLARLSGEQIGFKLRCGGVEASAFPSSQQVADALRACLDAGVPFKATAGLHHPLPRFDAVLQTRMHGFINLFLASVLAHARHLPVEQIRQILDDDRAEHFLFTAKGVSWRKVRATTKEITAARREAVLSFGSCSFEEPCADLRALGWLSR